MNYYMFDGYPFLNTFSKKSVDSLETDYGYKIKDIMQVPALTLQNVLEIYCDGQFPDLLDIDTEGMDLDILAQIDFSQNAPKIIIAETVIFGSVKKDPTVKNYLETKGFLAPYETPINTIFVRRDCWEKLI